MTMTTTQIEMEEIQAQQGYSAYMEMVSKSRSKGQESTSVYGIKVMEEMVGVMETSFNYFVEYQNTLRRKNLAFVHLINPAMKEVRTDKDGNVSPRYEVSSVISFLLAQTVCDKASSRAYLTSVATTMFKKLTRSFRIEIEDEEVVTSVMGGLVQMSRYLMESIEFANIIVEPRKRVNGVFTGGRAYIQFSDEKVAAMTAAAERIAQFQVFYKPMVVKPRPHTSLVSGKGGYLTLHSPLLKTPTKVNGKIHPSILAFKDESFFNLINHHQEVGYKVNKQMLEVIIPALIEMGAVGDSLHYNEGVLKSELSSGAAQEITDTNNSRIEKFGDSAFLLSPKAEEDIIQKWMNIGKQYVKLFNKTMEVATDYSKFIEFFYPIFLDDRARIYYYGKSLNPQGNELHRALLQFSEGTVMDDTKILDTYIAMGNAMGFDKKTVEFRQAKVIESLDTIISGTLAEVVALLDSDALLTGMAVAMDIRNYFEAKAKGVEYISYQPLHMDSCNSGSQINGVLLRDEKNCRLSNILNVSGDTLEDTYLEVAKGLHAKLQADTTGFFAKFLATPEIFNRNVFKKSSMTRSNYAASYLTCRQDMEYQLKTRFSGFWDTLTKVEKDAFFLEAVREVDASLPASNNFKSFARKLVTAAVKRDECLAFHNPRSGFPVVLRENEVEIKEVRYTEMFTGKAKLFNFKTFTKNLDKSGTISSSIPGITHSFDAGIIVGVKKRCGDIPMTTIHDSIAVLAGAVTGKLLPAIRDEYYDMAINDDLAVIRNELNLDTVIPYTGDLDIELIKTSKHLYS